MQAATSSHSDFSELSGVSAQKSLTLIQIRPCFVLIAWMSSQRHDCAWSARGMGRPAEPTATLHKPSGENANGGSSDSTCHARGEGAVSAKRPWAVEPRMRPQKPLSQKRGRGEILMQFAKNHSQNTTDTSHPTDMEGGAINGCRGL